MEVDFQQLAASLHIYVASHLIEGVASSLINFTAYADLMQLDKVKTLDPT